MQSIRDVISLLITLTRLTKHCNLRSAYYLFLAYYILLKLEQLLKVQLKLRCIPDEIFSFLIMKHVKCIDSSVDKNLYVLCNCNSIDKAKDWHYLCSKKSRKGYKVLVIFTNDVQEGHIYVSENMRFNINKHLNLENLEDPLYFLIPTLEEPVTYARQVKISLVSNPHDCKNELINDLLKKFFSSPRYLRLNDIFSINVKKCMPETQYFAELLKLETLFFKVCNVCIKNEQTQSTGGFIMYGKTTLIQKANVNSYIPYKCLCDIPFHIEKSFPSKWPPVFKKSLNQLLLCIAPFLQKDICFNIKPVFLVEGPSGSGKSHLIKASAEIVGLHLLVADFTDIQCLTSAQTEAKLKIIFKNAENCIPCILTLRNIQIFGINSEGQKDERVLSSFINEIQKLYSVKREYPVIIIATSNDSEIPIHSEKTFIEKITIGHLDESERRKMLSWFIESKGLKHQVDLQKISQMCSDFTLADLNALVLQAIRIRYKIHESSNEQHMELLNDDFISAFEYMKSLFSDEIGAPHVPKVYWEDIGGLADIKHEITRRIKMSLLNIPGLNKSGLLLYGPPGTGKTLLAKAVATECQLHFLSVKGPELLNMYVGQSEKNIRQVFERARSASPCIIFFDELDSLAPNRGQSGDSGGVMDRVVSQLLAELDGLESVGSVFVIAATNRPDLVDPALLRPGRFDKMLYVGICSDPDSRLSVLKALTRKFHLEDAGRELELLVHELPNNLTGADLYSVCSNAWLMAVRKILTNASSEESLSSEDVVVTLQDFKEAAKNLVPSISKEELLRYERLRDQLSFG